MLKKLVYLILLGGIGYLIFIPMAAEISREKLEEAGSADVSVFDLFEADQDQNQQDYSAEDES